MARAHAHLGSEPRSTSQDTVFVLTSEASAGTQGLGGYRREVSRIRRRQATLASHTKQWTAFLTQGKPQHRLLHASCLIHTKDMAVSMNWGGVLFGGPDIALLGDPDVWKLPCVAWHALPPPPNAFNALARPPEAEPKEAVPSAGYEMQGLSCGPPLWAPYLDPNT